MQILRGSLCALIVKRLRLRIYQAKKQFLMNFRAFSKLSKVILPKYKKKTFLAGVDFSKNLTVWQQYGMKHNNFWVPIDSLDCGLHMPS